MRLDDGLLNYGAKENNNLHINLCIGLVVVHQSLNA